MAKMTLDDLVQQLRAAYGDGLRAVVLYGSAATREQQGAHSDVNVLVLVDRVDLETLTREAAIARAWAEAGQPPPLTLTVDEWRGSTDVFAMEHADILEQHRVLHGALPTEGVVVQLRHLRLQLEYESLGKLLQLRQGILAAGGDPRRLRTLMERSLSTFMVLFRALLRLHGEVPPRDFETLGGRAGALAGFDPAPFQRLARHRRGAEPLPDRDAPALLADYLAGAERLVTFIDRMEIA